MKLADKIRYLREVEGSLRGLDRAMTQGELVRAIADETSSGSISQSYLSQIESGARPHLTNTTRLLLAKFFKVHPGYLVEDPEDFHAELRTPELAQSLSEDKLDLWLVAGAERFGRTDGKLCRALLSVAHHPDSRGCLLLLGRILETPALVDRLTDALAPRSSVSAVASRAMGPAPAGVDTKKPRKGKHEKAARGKRSGHKHSGRKKSGGKKSDRSKPETKGEPHA